MVAQAGPGMRLRYLPFMPNQPQFFALLFAVAGTAPAVGGKGESAVAAPNSVSLRHDGGRTGGDDSTSFNIDDAPFGFFVDGSSIVAVNGIHGPRLGAGSSELPPLLAPQVRLGLYLHASGSGWVLANLNRKVVSGSAVARGDEGRTISEWLFIDPGGRERFSYRPGT